MVFDEREGVVGFDDDEAVEAGGEVVLEEAEGFADTAFDEVALDGVAAAAADGDADFGRADIGTADGADVEGVGDAALAGGEDFVEARAAAETLGARETEAGDLGGGVGHQRIVTGFLTTKTPRHQGRGDLDDESRANDVVTE